MYAIYKQQNIPFSRLAACVFYTSMMVDVLQYACNHDNNCSPENIKYNHKYQSKALYVRPQQRMQTRHSILQGRS